LLRMTGSLTVGNPPPRLAKFASLICLGTPPVQVFHPDRAKRASGRGVLCLFVLQHICLYSQKRHILFLRSPYKPFKITGKLFCHPELKMTGKLFCHPERREGSPFNPLNPFNPFNYLILFILVLYVKSRFLK